MGVQLAMRDVRFIFFSDKVGLLIEMVCFMMLLFLQSRKKSGPLLDFCCKGPYGKCQDLTLMNFKC